MTDMFAVDKSIESCLPIRFLERYRQTLSSERIRADEINELRLRLGRPSSLTVMEQNMPLDICLTAAEMNECVCAFCRGSVYAHADTMRQGYIKFGSGIRVGVCGTLAPDGRGVMEVTSISVRLPHVIKGVAERILSVCCDGSRVRSVLICSPPGIGKTTLLRDIAVSLGTRYRKRVAVIDSRGELYMERMFDSSLCDVLIGYPRAAGVEIATRTMSPEVIICDEIGDADEARQLLAAQNTGVPIIASAHASDVSELLLRPNIRMLHDSCMFSYYICVNRERVNGRLGRSFSFSVTSREEIRCII